MSRSAGASGAGRAWGNERTTSTAVAVLPFRGTKGFGGYLPSHVRPACFRIVAEHSPGASEAGALRSPGNDLGDLQHDQGSSAPGRGGRAGRGGRPEFFAQLG